MPKLSAQARARKIKLLLFDVDGVLTDGKLFFIPDHTGQQGNSQLKRRKAGRRLNSRGFMPMMASPSPWRALGDSEPASLPGGIRRRLPCVRVTSNSNSFAKAIRRKALRFWKSSGRRESPPRKLLSWAMT